MKIHVLSGFLGSGKTTAIQQAAGILLQQGIQPGVITNDQGAQLVDGSFFKSLAIPGREVINGCFCCNYKDLDAGIASLIEKENTAVIFAESVGSCTDIVATVVKPLLQFRPGTGVTLSVLADVRLLQMMLSGRSSFNESVQYIYLKQLEEAGIIVVNKIDLISEEQLAILKELLQKKYGHKTLLYQHSLRTDDICQWLRVLNNDTAAAGLASLGIDYDLYAAGEAMMAWFDGEAEIVSGDNNALLQAEQFINTIYKKINEQLYPVGHIKFLVNNSIKISFTGDGQVPVSLPIQPAAMVSILINMRVQAAPAAVKQLVLAAGNELEQATGCRIMMGSYAAFQPGYPQPAFRM